MSVEARDVESDGRLAWHQFDLVMKTRDLVRLNAFVLLACRMPSGPTPGEQRPRPNICLMQDKCFTDFNESRSDDISPAWHLPGWLAPGDRNILLIDDDAVRSFCRRILHTNEAEGHGQSELLTAEIAFTNEACATIDFSLTRYDVNGEVMPPGVCPVSSVVLKNDGRWAINPLIFNAGSRICD